MNKKGFTLIEIMIVVSIIGILTAIALPGIVSSRQRASEVRAQAELSSLYKAITMFYLHMNRFPNELSELSDYITIANIEDKYELNPDL